MRELTISPDSFAIVCFLALMQNGEGLIDKSPSYITEKMYLLRSGLDAFGALDIYNKRKVIAWCKDWHIEIPEKVVENWEAEEQAVTELMVKAENNMSKLEEKFDELVKPFIGKYVYDSDEHENIKQFFKSELQDICREIEERQSDYKSGESNEGMSGHNCEQRIYALDEAKQIISKRL